MPFELTPLTPLDGEALIPLAAAKAHLRVDLDDEDDMIAAFRDAALDAVQQDTGVALVEQDFSWRGAFGRRVRLGVRPLVAITSISYLDAAGVAQLVDPDVYRIGLHDEIVLQTGQSWPATADGDDAVTVLFSAGHAAGAVPGTLLSAARLMIGHLFENRAAVETGGAGGEVPLGFRRLCDLYRMPGV